MRPSVIILGGSVNALSIARTLSRAGVDVHAINEPGSVIRHSRSLHWIPMPAGATSADWLAYLLGPRANALRGAVLLAASDAGVEAIARNRQTLGEQYIPGRVGRGRTALHAGQAVHL